MSTSKKKEIESVQCFGRKKNAVAVGTSIFSHLLFKHINHDSSSYSRVESRRQVSVFSFEILFRCTHTYILSLILLSNILNDRYVSTSTYTFKQSNTAYIKAGRGVCKVNGKPIEVLEPKPLREKAYEPILLLGKKRFADVDVRVRVKGGGSVAQTYAIRQSIAKGIVSFYQKCTYRS